MIGDEPFLFDKKELGFSMLDLWRFHYSNIYDIQGRIAEFIVARALGVMHSQSDQYWTLWDVSYRGYRIEVKATSYYHSFNQEGKISQQRCFGITKAHGEYDLEKSGNREFCRQNDIYVFCLNTGETAAEAYPLNLNNWEFYVVPTSFINLHCQNNKTLSLGRIRRFGFEALRYDRLRTAIDRIIDEGGTKQ